MSILPWLRKAAEPVALAETKQAPINEEIGYVHAGSSIHGFLNEYYVNPDQIIKRKGWKYLREMEDSNGYVYGLMRTRITSIKRRGWYVTPASDEPRDVEIAEFVTHAIDDMPGAFSDDLSAACDALKYGYSVIEKVWTKPTSGVYAGKIVPARLAPKQQENFRVKLDDFGNITEIVQRELDGLRWSPVPADKFIWASFEGSGTNPYGKGIYSRLFWHDWFLREGWKFWSVHTERYASPHVKVKTPQANLSDTAQDEAKKIVRMVRNDTGFIEPNGWEVSYLEAMRAGGAEYERFTEEQRNAIATVILGQTLTSSQGSIGSQALGTVHKEVQNEITDDDATWLFTALNEQFVRQLVAFNYPVDSYPLIGPEPRNDRDVKVWSEVLGNLSRGGLAIPTRWVYEEFGIEPPEGDEETMTVSIPATLFDGLTRDDSASDDDSVPLVRLVDKYPDTTDERPFWRKPTKFENRRILERMQRDLREIEDGAATESMKMFAESRDAMIAQVRKSGVFDVDDSDKRLAVIRGLNLGPKLNRYEELMRRAYLTAEFVALDLSAEELRDAGGDIPAKFDDYEFLEPGQLYNEYAAKEVVTKAQFRRMDQAARGYAWYVSTQDGERTVQIIRNALLETIQNDWTMREFEAAARRGYEDAQYITKALGTGTERGTTARLRTIYRNATMDAANATRMRLFQAAERLPNDPVVAYQVSAIMDDRTSAICQSIDGKIVRAGSNVLPRPPYHHNCRTVWIPILEERANEMDATDLIDKRPQLDGETWEPQQGFGRSL